MYLHPEDGGETAGSNAPGAFLVECLTALKKKTNKLQTAANDLKLMLRRLIATL